MNKQVIRQSGEALADLHAAMNALLTVGLTVGLTGDSDARFNTLHDT